MSTNANGLKLLSDMFANVASPLDEVQPCDGRIPEGNDIPASPVPKEDDTLASRTATALRTLKDFMGPRQLSSVLELMRGEEGDYFRQKMIELAAVVDGMPSTYQSSNEADPRAHLHYFIGGCDWWIVEKDVGSPDDEANGTPAQAQAFGFACLGDPNCAELGYISLHELFYSGSHEAELDFHWSPKAVSKIKASLFRDDDEGEAITIEANQP